MGDLEHHRCKQQPPCGMTAGRCENICLQQDKSTGNLTTHTISRRLHGDGYAWRHVPIGRMPLIRIKISKLPCNAMGLLGHVLGLEVFHAEDSICCAEVISRATNHENAGDVAICQSPDLGQERSDWLLFLGYKGLHRHDTWLEITTLSKHCPCHALYTIHCTP